MAVDESGVMKSLNGRLSRSPLPQDRKDLLHSVEVDRFDGPVGEHKEVVGVRRGLDSSVDEFVVVEEDSRSIGLGGGVVLHHSAEERRERSVRFRGGRRRKERRRTCKEGLEL